MSELQQLSGDKPLNGLLLPSALSGSNGNIPRGAEQSTIQKLKSNLELKEQQKMKIVNERHNHSHPKKDLSPRQFRTKAEMKGYVPLPVSLDANQANIESSSNPNTSSSAAPSAFDLLDWGSACNDFVQQLQTGNKKKVGVRKKRQVKSEEKSSSSIVPGTACGDLSQVPKEILNSINKVENASSSDEDKPLLELKRNLSQQDLTDKLSRNFREKQRQEVEQKFAARLGKPSSSESETDTRKVARSMKRVRRLRKRAALGIKHDDEHSKEEGAHSGETDDDVNKKKRSSKSISKLEDLTSSDDETDKKKVNSENNKKDESKKKVASNSKKPSNSTPDAKQSPSVSVKKESSSESSSGSSSTEEEPTMEDKINKLSERKNLKKLKDLGDKSNIKNLLEEEETMTRSKRKLEIEKKLSNSKILRNEKIVQNKVVSRGSDKKAHVAQAAACNNNKSKSLSPMKRKDSKADEMKRKAQESDSDEGNKLKNKKQRKSSKMEEHSSDNNSEVEEEIKAERYVHNFC
jgi:hypothetical protein